MPKTPRILVSWIGQTDMRAFAPHASDTMREAIYSVMVRRDVPAGNLGPLRPLLEMEDFDHIYLMSQFPRPMTKAYMDWLGVKAKVSYHSIDDPTDYRVLFEMANRELRRIHVKHAKAQYDLSLHLSPGTPAMAAIWVLLGKTRYPATFWQANEGKVVPTEVPFDLTVEYQPNPMHQADLSLHRLAARSPSEIPEFQEIAGDSPALNQAVERSRRAAQRSVPILLLGESGTGKEMFARAIHDASRRHGGPFRALNCAALPGELLESELFGHRKGAFTGATRDRRGYFEQADGGTLFLDEIGECSPSTQAKLLRILQPRPDRPPCLREFYPLGSDRPVLSDVRIVAATNRDLLDMVNNGQFREDLYYRLAVVSVAIPPLRDRESDAMTIALKLLDDINHEFAADDPDYVPKQLANPARALIRGYHWPGNVRELYNVLLQAAIMSDGDSITDTDLRPGMTAEPDPSVKPQEMDLLIGDGFVLDDLLADIQRHYLARAMDEANGVKVKAAKLLGFRHYQTLDQRMKRLASD